VVVLFEESGKNEVYNPTNSNNAICVNPKNLRYLRAKKPPKQFEILYKERCPVRDLLLVETGISAPPACRRYATNEQLANLAKPFALLAVKIKPQGTQRFTQ
jgi:hypothetical protein